ncbi:iron complex transport system permease protein [Nitratireductor aquibiodomus]|uniref:Iron complex transport system permease protein n=1 Tax=Nitratireductor aquibiodomus TaxID=204799 RepID=A0A1H4JTK8_9HYPH|nr:iron ABC transporter permease [Nitratireductor aquibiodomus]SEB49346.1 iron complex transport system permease protein [Nitratireductor aquibiodomus]
MTVIAQGLDRRLALFLPGGLKIRLVDLSAFCGLLLATLAMLAFSLSVGTTDLGPLAIVRALVSGPGGSDAAFAIWDVRLPRILMGLMVGWCIALTGAMLQSLSQNPLADPGLLGLSQGSLTTIMIALVFFPAFPQAVLPLAALAGGLAVGCLLIALVGRSNASGMSILLMGIAIETSLSSITTILVLYTPPEVSQALGDWMAGSLFRSSWSALAAFMPWCVVSLPIILFLGRRLRSYDLGDQMAMALGEPVRYSKPLILLAAVLLTSASVTAVGPLVFLGIMAPHIANFIAPASGRARLVLSAMVGGLLVIAADALTRALIGEIAMPTGLSIVLIGVPVFIVTLRLRALARRATH